MHIQTTSQISVYSYNSGKPPPESKPWMAGYKLLGEISHLHLQGKRVVMPWRWREQDDLKCWHLYIKRTIAPQKPIIAMFAVIRYILLLIKLYFFCFFHAMCRYFNSVQTFELQKFSELIFCQREEAVTFYGCRTAAVILLSKGGSMYNMQQIYRS